MFELESHRSSLGYDAGRACCPKLPWTVLLTLFCMVTVEKQTSGTARRQHWAKSSATQDENPRRFQDSAEKAEKEGLEQQGREKRRKPGTAPEQLRYSLAFLTYKICALKKKIAEDRKKSTQDRRRFRLIKNPDAINQ